MDAIKKEYREAADAVRCAQVVTPEMDARYTAAKAAFDAQRAQTEGEVAPKAPGWWNLPVADSCWAGDGRDLNA
ncbi:hypothetical protein PSP6_700007 [Paraburkholderia tropica]|uniref:hypothetical protein n=1 Tax=Paraburkholderia tropica TaxID=92647 RepID=UPI001CAC2E48|nr:hypothetical protein [Paraburkholderia tropica]CAG9236910.1 hypothetical protein PSP6_700007 [Paraburkholderia tropica]